MNRHNFRRIALSLLVAPLALGLAACGDKQEGDGKTPVSEVVAKVAPPAGKAWSDVIARTPEGGYRMGNPDAPIKLVEYASLTCPHCAEFSEKSSQELAGNFVASGRVSYEFRNFVRDPIDVAAAQLTRCGAPESFFALTEQVFAYQPQIFEKAQAAGEAAYANAMNLPEDKRGVALGQITGLTEFIASRGIAVDQANACLADGATARAMAKAAQEQGTQFEIQGTPTFIINGKKSDINTWEEVKAALENLGAR